MRAVSLHRDVIVLTSAIWQTNCTIVRGPSSGAGGGEPGEPGVEGAAALEAETFVIDSPLLPEELELLPGVLEQSGYEFSGLLVTHSHWDHLLARLAFPGAALGCAETTAARLTAEPGAAQRELRDFDERHYLARARPLALGDVQALPVPGHCELGAGELELHPTEGHTDEGMAVRVPWAAVLVAGDYLSPLEIPWLDRQGGSLGAYLATLERLRPLVADSDRIVPGHGEVIGRERALALLEEDVAYLRGLAAEGAEAQLPAGRRGAAQRAIHAENVSRL